MVQDRPTDVSSIDGFHALALAHGCVRDIQTSASGRMVHADMYGDCTNPVEMYRAGWTTGPAGHAELDTISGSLGRERRAYSVRLRCRKCDKCLQARARYWRKAATFEMQRSALLGARTWFGTLTLAPEHHAEALYRAYARVGGIAAWGQLTPEQQFAERHTSVSASLTKSVKRLRKEVGVRSLRYLIVCEAHKSGLPHYHMLLHETSALLPIRKSTLEDFWRLGFSQWRLAKPEAARYVAKYLSKAALARVRASLRYGSWVQQTTSVTSPTCDASNVPHTKGATREGRCSSAACFGDCSNVEGSEGAPATS